MQPDKQLSDWEAGLKVKLRPSLREWEWNDINNWTTITGIKMKRWCQWWSEAKIFKWCVSISVCVLTEQQQLWHNEQLKAPHSANQHCRNKQLTSHFLLLQVLRVNVWMCVSSRVKWGSTLITQIQNLFTVRLGTVDLATTVFYSDKFWIFLNVNLQFKNWRYILPPYIKQINAFNGLHSKVQQTSNKNQIPF